MRLGKLCFAVKGYLTGEMQVIEDLVEKIIKCSSKTMNPTSEIAKRAVEMAIEESEGAATA